MSESYFGSLSTTELIQACNRLAATYYRAHGYKITPGYRFDRSEHPHERGMWDLAAIAFDHLLGIDVEEILLDEEENDES